MPDTNKGTPMPNSEEKLDPGPMTVEEFHAYTEAIYVANIRKCLALERKRLKLSDISGLTSKDQNRSNG